MYGLKKRVTNSFANTLTLNERLLLDLLFKAHSHEQVFQSCPKSPLCDNKGCFQVLFYSSIFSHKSFIRSGDIVVDTCCSSMLNPCLPQALNVVAFPEYWDPDPVPWDGLIDNRDFRYKPANIETQSGFSNQSSSKFRCKLAKMISSLVLNAWRSAWSLEFQIGVYLL